MQELFQMLQQVHWLVHQCFWKGNSPYPLRWFCACPSSTRNICIKNQSKINFFVSRHTLVVFAEFVSEKLLEDTYEVCNDGTSGECKKGFGGYEID
ncbi:unnamed protein product [Trifolium pratense]|uniref:Uncharacterized protein n=1 Tax=Trifolium pratense TaxID=57577 RepID=A0ACB0M195_TRIPR|nr:unnamed protein product [Trifolium pratense]